MRNIVIIKPQPNSDPALVKADLVQLLRYKRGLKPDEIDTFLSVLFLEYKT